MKIERIEHLIIKSLQELKEALDEENLDLLDSEIMLFGDKGILDSMGLVSLITDMEERIEDEFGISLILADESAMSQRKSPFRTVSSLAKYVYRLIKEERLNEGP